MSNFQFLKGEWPTVHEAASRAEAAIHADPRTACFYARRALELAVQWAYQADDALRRPYQDNLSALVHEPCFKQTAGEAVFNKARVIIKLGNLAVHTQKRILQFDALTVVRELFHVGYWLAHTYARKERPAPGLTFDDAAVPRADGEAAKHTRAQLEAMEKALAERDAKLSALSRDRDDLDAELARLRAEVAAAKKASQKVPDTHDYSEAETRDYFIDLLLKEAGWTLEEPRDREFEVAGMPNAQGKGFVDYVLWGDDGKPLGLVEAKRTKKSPHVGQQQAKLYADCLEKAHGQRPLIFYTNGYEHWLWDDLDYPPRAVAGFLTKAELQLRIQRRTSKKPLAEAVIDKAIVERYYQQRAIRKVTESFEEDCERKALIVMATGAGKTRTVIALSDVLMRHNWVKRVLFLADRVALVTQAVGAFKKHLPASSPVNLVTEKDKDGRVFVSTYPTMMGLIDETHPGSGLRRFGPGYFDLVVVDEAHRSIYQKYGAIFRYFDALLVGLTATPKNEIDFNTYAMFGLERGVPTDAYELKQAVADGFLVPAESVSVPLKFQREGIQYADLTEEEKERWDEIEWDEDGDTRPDRVEPDAVNKWLFNTDTVDKVLQHLMARGQRVAGGDRLGKTIVFAKNQQHAEFIAQRFDKSYPHMKGAFARVIHCGLPYAETLIHQFSDPDAEPHIAISVDMLDTGIDVPEVVNLVFFKPVRSSTKFWQMVGRGTRLCKELFGPGVDKAFFYIFDFCGNLEFFSQNPKTSEGRIGASLGQRLFTHRLELMASLEGVEDGPAGTSGESAKAYVVTTTETVSQLRTELAETLQREVAAMNLDNFLVREKRRAVEKFSKRQAWDALGPEDLEELAHQIAGLPSELPSEREEAKRFDLLILSLQLAILKKEPSVERLQEQVRAIAGLLEEKSTIPTVFQQMPLIHEVQTDEYWQGVTLPMLDTLRKRLRALVQFIEKGQRRVIYTEIVDTMGDEVPIALPEMASGEGFEKFRVKARAYLREHEDHLAIQKLRRGKALTQSDLDELERMLAAIGGEGAMERIRAESEGLGVFVRSLVGLDREAAKEAFGAFLDGTTLSANQIAFVDMLIDHLTEHGMMDAGLLYESPFTDIAPTGPDDLFTSEQVGALVDVLERLRASAQAA